MSKIKYMLNRINKRIKVEVVEEDYQGKALYVVILQDKEKRVRMPCSSPYYVEKILNQIDFNLHQTEGPESRDAVRMSNGAELYMSPCSEDNRRLGKTIEGRRVGKTNESVKQALKELGDV